MQRGTWVCPNPPASESLPASACHIFCTSIFNCVCVPVQMHQRGAWVCPRPPASELLPTTTNICNCFHVPLQMQRGTWVCPNPPASESGGGWVCPRPPTSEPLPVRTYTCKIASRQCYKANRRQRHFEVRGLSKQCLFAANMAGLMQCRMVQARAKQKYRIDIIALASVNISLLQARKHKCQVCMYWGRHRNVMGFNKT
eukprot:1146191-Pelagomonas_calceolata.AAC.2